MKNLVRKLLASAIRYAGIGFFIREVYARKKVSIVLYHDPKPEVVDKHLAYLAKRYTFITLDLLVDAIYSRDWSRVPERSLVITLDDGHKTNFELLGVFRKYRVIPTLYVCSQIVGTHRRFWFKIPGLDSNGVSKHFSNSERIGFLRQEYGFDATQEYPEEERMALSRGEIEAMKDFVDFQSHTRSHPVLTTCSDDACREEIAQSRTEVEKLTGTRCEHFSYPNGDYTKREIELVKKAGYRSARTIDVGWNTINTDPYRLKITGIDDDASINMLVAQMCGAIPYLGYLLKGSFNGRHPTIRLNRL